jgi:hypothetical protein
MMIALLAAVGLALMIGCEKKSDSSQPTPPKDKPSPLPNPNPDPGLNPDATVPKVDENGMPYPREVSTIRSTIGTTPVPVARSKSPVLNPIPLETNPTPKPVDPKPPVLVPPPSGLEVAPPPREKKM